MANSLTCKSASGSVPAVRTVSAFALDSGFANLTPMTFTATELWCHFVMIATEIMAWTQMIGFNESKARRWEPKKLRARLLEIGGKLARRARQTTLH